MTTPRIFEPSGLDYHAQSQLVNDGRRAGITEFQVLALVRSDDRLMLVGSDRLTLPTAWVRPYETVSGTLNRLCTQDLGLTGWKASFADTAVCRLPDTSVVLQFGFDITLAGTTEPGRPGTCHWWQTHTAPPALHPLARPLVEKLYTVPAGLDQGRLPDLPHREKETSPWIAGDTAAPIHGSESRFQLVRRA
ncbi:hypothetical protein [Streptomyces sp. NPDC087297]|uniref:hypothetical protein n=1 Tax=Streptomyces sp. NPDC087297 TaxID=3365778 RepID=UPI0038114288